MAQASRYGGTQRGTVDDEFQSFPDYESGRRAQRDLWKTKPYQDRTVRAAIKRWSPDATEVHVNEMLTAANASNGEKSMRDVSDAELNALMDVQQKWEGWIPPTATTPASRSYNNNNPGNIKRTDTMMQDPTSPTRPVNDGSPDTPSGNVNMVYAGTDKELLALFGKDGSEGARSVPLRQRETAIGQGWMIESVPVEQTAESIEPINWRGHVSHAAQRAGIDSPENAANTLAESLPTLGAIGGGAIAGWGAVPAYAAGQGARELIQNRSEILPAMDDIESIAHGRPMQGSQERWDAAAEAGDIRQGNAAYTPPEPTLDQSPSQAMLGALKGGVMGDIVNLLPGARRGRQALQSLDEGNPYTASVQGVGAGLDALTGFGGGAIARGIKATPWWQNLLAAGGGGAGSAVGGELAGHVGEEWLDLTPDQQRAFEAYGELLGGGVAGGALHPISRERMGNIVTHPVVAGSSAALAASAHMPAWAASGVGVLSATAATAARRRTREARTADNTAQQAMDIAATREATRQRERGEDQARTDTREATRQRERGENRATTAERAVVRDAQWDARGRERIAAAKTLAEAREAQQAHSRQAALDRTQSAESKAALVARGKLALEAKKQEIEATQLADARAERVDREQGRQEITAARRTEDQGIQATNRAENRAERLANRTESRRIARENRQETLRIALDRAETADLHYAERRSDRISAAETLAEIRREKLELDREIRADKNATNAKKEEIRKLIDETARAREAELSEGLEAGDPKVVVRSIVNDDGVQRTTTQTLRPASEESGGGSGDPAGEILMRPEPEGPSGTTRQEPTSPASPSPDTPGLSEADAILVADYDQKLGVSQSRNLAEPLRKRHEELATKEMLNEPLSEAEFIELDDLDARFKKAGTRIGSGFQVAGSPGNRTLPDPTIIDRSRDGSGSRRGRR